MSMTKQFTDIKQITQLLAESESAAVTNDKYKLLWTNDPRLTLGRIHCDCSGICRMSSGKDEITLRRQTLNIEGSTYYLLTPYHENDIQALISSEHFKRFYSARKGKLRLLAAGRLDTISHISDPLEAHKAKLLIRQQNTKLLSAFQNSDVIAQMICCKDEENELINIHRELTSFLENAKEIAKANGCELSFDISKNIFIKADPGILRCVVSNLIINSFMYNKTESKTARVTAKEVSDRIIITVTDNAGGIADETAENIKLPFYDHGNSGEGLGLFIASFFAKELGGELKLINENGGLKAVLDLGSTKFPSDDELRLIPPVPYPTLLEKEYIILAKGISIVDERQL